MSILGVRFTGQVTLGNLMSAFTIVVAAVAVYKDLSGAVVNHDKQLAVQETRLTAAEARLNVSDVTQARVTTKLDNLENLMEEVRDELRTSNREGRP